MITITIMVVGLVTIMIKLTTNRKTVEIMSMTMLTMATDKEDKNDEIMMMRMMRMMRMRTRMIMTVVRMLIVLFMMVITMPYRIIRGKTKWHPSLNELPQIYGQVSVSDTSSH